MDERADITDQPGTTPEPPAPRGDPGREIAALVLSILSFVLLPVVGAVIAIALVGRSWKGSNSPIGNAARIVATVNLYVCLFVVGVIGILAGKDALDRNAEESFKEVGEAIGDASGDVSVGSGSLTCRLDGQFEEGVWSGYAVWSDTATVDEILTSLDLLDGADSMEEFFKTAPDQAVREMCDLLGGSVLDR